VTSLAGTGARNSPPRNVLGSISPMFIGRLLCHWSFMIAPDGNGRKGFKGFSVPIPKFARLCGVVACEPRNRRTPTTY
jgi:hypothetical protein